MKKREANNPGTPSKGESHSGLGSDTAAMLNAILKIAYRRHARGRLAREAVTACFGQ